MRLLKITLLLSMFLFVGQLSAQLTISAQGGEAATGENLQVDITAELFNDLTTFQFNVVWDSLVMTFVEVTNVTTELSGYSLGTNFGTPGDGSIKDGTVSTSWTDFTSAQNLPDNTVLFSIILNAIGDECDMSSFAFENEEAADENFEEVTVTATDSEILVSGTDCGNGGGGGDDCGSEGFECEGSSDIVLSFPDVTAANGSTVCFPVSVYNFTNVEGVQTGILFDPTQLTYQNVQNFNLPGLDGNLFNAGDADEGMIRQFWTEPTGEEPVTLDDETVIYEICFEVIAEDGTCVEIDFGSIGNFNPEAVVGGVEVPLCLDGGTVFVGNPPSPDFELIASDESANMGDEVCVAVSVKEFNSLRGLQFDMTWDNSVVEYSSTQSYNAAIGVTESNLLYTEPPVNLRFAWDNLTPLSLPDDAVLFEVCFDAIGDCETGESTVIEFVDGDIEVIDADANELDYALNNGSVTILPCGHTCEFISVSQPDCAGDSGSIIVSVDADDTCSCNWYITGQSTPIQTTPGDANCNLSSVTAGNYTFELTNAQGDVVCTFDQAITDPPAITTNPVIMSAGCGDSGSITLNASGGTGTLMYDWTPDVSTGDEALDLAADEYTILITDANDCSETVTITITNEIADLMIDESQTMITSPSCVGGDDGAISVVVTGGCPEYSFDWSSGNGTGLEAGTYSVTVTDANGNTDEAEFVVNDPLPIVLTENIVNANGGNNGSIVINVENGTAPYTYSWSPNVSNSEAAVDLAAGSYSVTVTDDNGCTASLTDLIVIDEGSGFTVSQPIIGDVLGCAEDCDGVISSNVGGGTAPYNAVLSGAANLSLELAESGSFSFDDLCGGVYTLAVTDADGMSVTYEDLVVESAEALEATVSVGSDNADCDGFISIDVSGGTAPYTYEWSQAGLEGSLAENLCAGAYNIMITDVMGCQFLVNAVVQGTDDICYQPLDIITPNDDGKNDFFIISCINQRPASLEIYDRYGRLVYNNAQYNNEFNGISDDGVELGEGGYMWVLDIDFGNGQREVVKGTLTLLRG